MSKTLLDCADGAGKSLPLAGDSDARALIDDGFQASLCDLLRWPSYSSIAATCELISRISFGSNFG